MSIREATEADYPELGVIVEECHLAYQRRFEPSYSDLVLMSEDDSQAVGLVVGNWTTTPDWSDRCRTQRCQPPHAFISLIAVRHPGRRQDHARDLLHAFTRKALAAGVSFVVLTPSAKEEDLEARTGFFRSVGLLEVGIGHERYLLGSPADDLLARTASDRA